MFSTRPEYNMFIEDENIFFVFPCFSFLHCREGRVNIPTLLFTIRFLIMYCMSLYHAWNYISITTTYFLVVLSYVGCFFIVGYSELCTITHLNHSVLSTVTRLLKNQQFNSGVCYHSVFKSE